MTETKNPKPFVETKIFAFAFVLNIVALVFEICFGFRASIFGF